MPLGDTWWVWEESYGWVLCDVFCLLCVQNSPPHPAKTYPKWSKCRPNGTPKHPSRPQDGPKITQRGPKGPKRGPDADLGRFWGLLRTKKSSKMEPKWFPNRSGKHIKKRSFSEDGIGRHFLCFFHPLASKMESKRSPSNTKVGPKNDSAPQSGFSF